LKVWLLENEEKIKLRKTDTLVRGFHTISQELRITVETTTLCKLDTRFNQNFQHTYYCQKE